MHTNSEISTSFVDNDPRRQSININHFYIQQFICSKYVGVEWLEASSLNLLSKQKRKIRVFFVFWQNSQTNKRMSNSIQPAKSLVRLLSLLMVIYSIQLCESHIAELLFEEEDSPAAVAENFNHFPSAHAAPLPPPTNEDNTCHVEFTVLKRAVGRCVKIGRATRACISGTYIHPFHPDCM